MMWYTSGAPSLQQHLSSAVLGALLKLFTTSCGHSDTIATAGIWAAPAKSKDELEFQLERCGVAETADSLQGKRMDLICTCCQQCIGRLVEVKEGGAITENIN
jgi:hypothetical protein